MIQINGEVIEFDKFPNGEIKLTRDNVPSGLNLTITLKYEDDSDLIKLMFLKKYIDEKTYVGHGHKRLIIYYMPYSRMDRVEDGSAFTLKYICEFINDLKFSEVFVVEPHSNVTLALLNNVKPLYINFDLLPKVMKHVGFDSTKDILFFPDEGASKRYKDIREPYLVGHKNRSFSTGIIESLEVVGKIPTKPFNVIIVDDLSSYGGTFIFSAEKLKEIGADKIYLLVAHAENSIFEGEIFRTDLIDGVFTTNSILSKQGAWMNKAYDSKLTVYDMNRMNLI